MSLCFAICSLLSLCRYAAVLCFLTQRCWERVTTQNDCIKDHARRKNIYVFLSFLATSLKKFCSRDRTPSLGADDYLPSPPPPYPVPHRCSLKRETYLHCYEKLFRFYVPQLWLFKTSTNFNKISVEVQRLPASALVVFVTEERSFVTESENNSNQQKHFGD